VVRPFLPFLARDLVLLAITAALVVADRALTGGEGALPVVVGVAAGAMAAVLAFLVHEWGHLIGTFVSGGVAHARPSLLAIFLFHFDVEKSTRRQFLAMSYGGYGATALAIVPLAAWIDPSRVSGITGLVLSVLGIGATLVLEIPTTVRVARGGALPSGGVYEGRPTPEAAE
jgi:hypothetical protein